MVNSFEECFHLQIILTKNSQLVSNFLQIFEEQSVTKIVFGKGFALMRFKVHNEEC